MSSVLIIKFIVLILYFKFVYSVCPPNTTFALESKCYKAVQLAKRYAEASGICRQTYLGQLASIPNEYVNTYLNGVASEYFSPYAESQFWLGGNDLKVPNEWTWEDGTNWNFTKWEKSHPKINDTVRNCVSMWIENGKWISIDCNEERFFICSFGHIPTTPIYVKPTTTCDCDKPSSTAKPLSKIPIPPTTLKPLTAQPKSPTPKITAVPLLTPKATKAAPLPSSSPKRTTVPPKPLPSESKPPIERPKAASTFLPPPGI